MAQRKITCILAMAATAFLAPLSAQAWERIHQWSAHVQHTIHHWVESHHTPWFMYFPCGEPDTMTTFGQGFPSWPSNFPPPQNGLAWQFSTPALPAYAPSYAPMYAGPGMGYPSSALGQPTGQTAGYGPFPSFMPAANSNMSAPSYWFAR